MPIRYYLEPNPVKPDTYRAVLLTGKKASFEMFLDHCALSSTVARADAMAVVEIMRQWIIARAKEGTEVDFGPLGYTRLGMKGVFTSRKQKIEEDEYDITIGFTAARKLQKDVNLAAKKAGLQRRSPPSSFPNINSVRDMMTDTRNAYYAGGLLQVYGSRLKFNPDKNDEGVFLQSPSDGRPQRCQQYIKATDTRIHAIIPESITGPQNLTVKRRHPPSRKNLLSTTYEKTLQPI